jgi:uncharacterized protein (DUF305 family)
MNTRVLVSAAGFLAMLSIGAIAQTQPQDHQGHHPGGSQPQTQAAPPSPPAAPSPPQTSPSPGQGQMPMRQMPMGQMMQGMPDQCRAMMQNMPQNCMSMMQQMMQARRGMMPGGMETQSTNQTPATKAYMEAAEHMHGPMMEGIQTGDPDAAFVRGMIPHHQGAIDMAVVVLQYGKDEQTKKWASNIIRDQQREITEMQEWLKKNAR